MIQRMCTIIVLLSMAVVGVVAGCAGHADPLSRDNSDAKTLWRHRYQYVRLEPRERCGGKIFTANGHPAVLQSDHLKSVLASLRIDSYDAEKPVPVFTRMEMEVLIDPLVKAFKLATPDEDIAVAIEGAHSSAMGYQRTITTARLFLQDRDLHIVFGKLHAPIDDYDSPLHMEPSDRRLKPFVQGSRCLDGDRKFPVLLPFGTVHFFEQGGTVRKNRLVISLSGVHQPMGTPRATVMSLTNPSLPETASPAVTDSDSQAPERKMPAGLPSKKLSIEERLRILKHLRDKDLITDQEYNDKKRDILDNL